MDLILASYLVLAVGAGASGFTLGFWAKEWARLDICKTRKKVKKKK